MIRLHFIILVVSFLSSGCSGEATIFNVDEACELYVETWVDKLARECELMSVEAAEETIIEGFAAVDASSCDDFDALRDKDAFYDECLPGIEALTCDDVLRTVPEACEMQLLQGD